MEQALKNRWMYLTLGSPFRLVHSFSLSEHTADTINTLNVSFPTVQCVWVEGKLQDNESLSFITSFDLTDLVETWKTFFHNFFLFINRLII